MKNIRLIGLVVLAILAFSVIASTTASAATILWLANGAAVTTAEPGKTTGSLEFGNESGLGLGIKIAFLCEGSFDGTFGPGLEDAITEVLSKTGTNIILPTMLACTNVKECPEAEVAPFGLPWLTELMGPLSKPIILLLNGGKGEPGWEVMCHNALIGLVEEECTGVASAVAKNAATDVEGEFLKAENNKFTCTNSTSGFVSTENDGAGLLTLNSGATLSMSEE